jgi:uncharacterized protein YbjT (DUF2867 family)
MALTLVMGATGTVGKEVVRELGSRGVRTRAFVRDRERAARILGPDVELALGDLTKPASVEAALEGVSRLFLLAPSDPRQAEWEALVADAARRAGVAYAVKLSALNAAPDSSVDDLRWHWQGEHSLAESGIPHAVIRCNFFAQFFLIFAPAIRAESRFRAPVREGPGSEGKVSPVDARDIAASAAALLASDAPADDALYELTGPEALGYPDVAARLSAALGRKVEYETVSTDESWRELLAEGHPEFEAKILLQLFERIQAGHFARVTSSVEALTGRSARPFDHFANAYRDSFA